MAKLLCFGGGGARNMQHGSALEDTTAATERGQSATDLPGQNRGRKHEGEGIVGTENRKRQVFQDVLCGGGCILTVIDTWTAASSCLHLS
ncbi:hypothetical protein DAPPUDRAFT_246231 [Daphnia pulex]|uniref:Uncharacterized protein n=1 Tax=Daphnia pulex TaxID=6669 RepID=E9GPX5_DAPPU|nr:hypothetical protein DAPPUDRAFT_246231 [Daphnia pulex]|eukprot:EFX78462.1 hypothetical protein DAPPUDRAFT_246231 [Daphnia pulex]